MEELTRTIQELPWLGMIPVALVFLLGLVLWAAGRRVLRTGFAAGGLLAGIAAGLAAANIEAIATLGVPPWTIALAAAVIVAIVCAVLYRIVLAATIGVLLGGLVPLGVWTGVDLGWFQSDARPAQAALPSDPPPAGNDSVAAQDDEINRWLDDWFGAGGAEPGPSAAAEEPKPTIEETAVRSAATWLEWLREATDAAVEAPKVAWAQMSQPLRWSLVAAAGVGVLLGLILGAAAPSLSASMVTALGGALLLLVSGWITAIRLGAGDWPGMPSNAVSWLAWWVAAAVIGLGVQWTIRPKRADKSVS